MAPRYTSDECISALQEYDRRPTVTEWRDDSRSPSVGVLQRRFGSWGEAVEAAGFSRPDSKNRKRVDTDYFASVDTPEKAYFLGLLYGDGCMYDHGERYQLILELTDTELVEQFKSAVSSQHKTVYNSEKETARISIGSREFCENLIDKGVTPDKTHFSRLPDLTEDHRGHFVRGLYDADGFKDGARWGICGGSRELLEGVQEWLPVDSNWQTDNRNENPNYHIRVENSDGRAVLSDWLYPEGIDTQPALSRKRLD